jgi:hypothetical protein
MLVLRQSNVYTRIEYGIENAARHAAAGRI